MKRSNMETRVLAGCGVELRGQAQGENRAVRIGGLAAPYNVWTDNLREFRERIAPGAFADSMGGDILCLVNHDDDQLLGRTVAGTLNLRDESRGLGFELDTPNTSLGRDVAELVRRGDMRGVSVSWEKNPADKWETIDGKRCRTIQKAKLLEISLTPMPVYETTSADVRAILKRATERRSDGATEGEEDGGVPDSCAAAIAAAETATEACRALVDACTARGEEPGEMDLERCKETYRYLRTLVEQARLAMEGCMRTWGWDEGRARQLDVARRKLALADAEMIQH